MPVIPRQFCILALAAGLAAAPACADPAAPPAGGGGIQGQMPRLSASNTLGMCFQRIGEPAGRSECIGEYTQACMTLSSDGQSNAGMARCAGEEYQAWQAQLEAAREALAEGLEAAPVAALGAAQEAWRATRDADCEWLASLYGEGSQAELERANCLMRETAERTILLQRWNADYPPF